MPLTMTKAGDTVTIRKITGKDEVRQVKEARIALDKTLAMRIIVA